MEQTSAEHIGWLERMHQFMTWKVVGPDFQNPYERQLSIKALSELAGDLDALRRFTQVRGMMDGEEILLVKSLKDLRIKTDHPSLTKLSAEQLGRYFEKTGVNREIEAQLKVIQRECQEELERRKREL